MDNIVSLPNLEKKCYFQKSMEGGTGFYFLLYRLAVWIDDAK